MKKQAQVWKCEFHDHPGEHYVTSSHRCKTQYSIGLPDRCVCGGRYIPYTPKEKKS